MIKRQAIQNNLSKINQPDNNKNLTYNRLSKGASSVVGGNQVPVGNNNQVKSSTASNYNQVTGNGIVRKKVENLARTGVEYPIMRDIGHAPFI
jgi:hypothetical protein